ncbi:MAG: stalk domain-containing protein [Bacillota bacterium]|nr:stalk domain-containing protein [Bacillota bacterium]
MRKINLYVIVAFAVIICIGQVVFAQNNIKWSKSLEVGKINLKGVAYDGKGLFVAVGEDGRIKTSKDAVKWTGRESGTIECLNSVTYGDGKFVAVGEGVIVVSQDGVNWASQASVTLNSVTWSGSKFYAVGKFGAVVTSLDGYTWENEQIQDNETLNDIFASDGELMIVGEKGGFYSSEAGGNWIKSNISLNTTLNAVCWNGSKYIAISDSGSVVASMDGKSWAWVSYEASLGGTTKEVNGSSKGLLELGSGIKDICWDGKEFIVIGFKGAIFTSETGTKWVKVSSGTEGNLESIIYTGKEYVAVGSDGVIMTASSPDKWKAITVSNYTNCFNSVVWGKDKFVAVGNSGTILVSFDGQSWIDPNYKFESDFVKVIWTGKNFVAVGTSGTIITSNDGIKWKKSNSGIYGKINSIAWSGKIYVGVGDSGEILTSTDCIKWNISNSGTYSSIDRIVWNGVNFIATEGKDGDKLISSDGKIWSRATHLKAGIVKNQYGDTMIFPDADNINRNIPEIKNLSQIIWNGSEYIGVGALTESHVETMKNENDEPIRIGNSTLTSKDGISWTNEALGSFKNLKGVSWNGEVLVAVGEDGVILSSIPAYIKVDIDGKLLESDTPPLIRNGRTLAPLRSIFEALGMKVDWNEATKTITAYNDKTTIQLKLGSKDAIVNGNAIKLDEPANTIRNRTLVPLRFIAENLGAKVSWDKVKKTVFIKTA